MINIYPAAQRNDLSLSNKKDNLDGGNIASGTLGILVVDFVIYGILFDPLRVIVNVQRFVRESKFFFSNYCIANLHTTIGENCVHGIQKRIGNFRKERMTRSSAWLPVFAVPSYGNYSFCSCNPLGQSFVIFLS